MGNFIPKSLTDDYWRRLTGGKNYAVRCAKEDVKFRLGVSGGVYFTVAQITSGLLVKLISFDDGNIIQETPFPKGKVIKVGRTDETELKIKHAIVSRKHVSFKLDGDILIVRDYGSTNGTFLIKENIFFDIEDYIKNHPPEIGGEGTLDGIHEEFGPTLDDFLISYQKEQN